MKRRVSIAQARNDLPALVHETEDHPVEIERRGKRVAVLISAAAYDRLTSPGGDLWTAVKRFRATHDVAYLDLIRLRPNARFMRRLRASAGETAIASVTWHEAIFGMLRMPAGKRRDAVRAYMYEVVAPTTPVLPYDTLAAEIHGERARLHAAGRTPTFADGQLAAIAVANNLVLVTANAKDFKRFEGLSVESWIAR